MSLLPLIVIVGPTAVGKTALSIQLAQEINGEIISGDSMQVYRYMDIGTAKPTMEEREGVPHHLIDILDPDEEYSVALFQRKVEELIPDIISRGRIPILAGGTGLYVRSVIDHYDFTEFAVDWDFRNQLKLEAKERGNEFLHRQLADVDPESAKRIHQNDLKRIIRAIEVYHYTGNPISSYQRVSDVQEPKYNLLMCGLQMDRQKLYERINQRVDLMVDNGLVDEVSNLLKMGYSPDLSSMRGLGYKEIVNYLREEWSLDFALSELKKNTRHFAKRQLTWFRSDQRINWFDVENYQSIREIASEINSKAAGQFIRT